MPRSQSMNVLFVLLLCCPSSGPVILASVGLVAARVVILQDGIRPLLAEGAAKRAANRASVHAGGDGAVPHAPGELVPQPHLKNNKTGALRQHMRTRSGSKNHKRKQWKGAGYCVEWETASLSRCWGGLAVNDARAHGHRRPWGHTVLLHGGLRKSLLDLGRRRWR